MKCWEDAEWTSFGCSGKVSEGLPMKQGVIQLKREG